MPGKIKFYLDEHVPRAVVQGLRERGVDIKTVGEAGLLSAPDTAHLQRARAERRVILRKIAIFSVSMLPGILIVTSCMPHKERRSEKPFMV